MEQVRRKFRIRILLLAAIAAALSSLSFGSILCDGAPTTISAAIAGGGCQFGSNLFTNFSIATSSEFAASADAINPGTVEVAFTGATTNPGVVNLIFSNSDAAAWALSGASQFDLIVTYTVTGSSAYFTQFADSFSGSATSTGAISFDKMANGQILPTLGTPANTSNPPQSLGGSIQTFNVTDNIIVHATNSSATLGSATNSFTMGTPVTSSPEPLPVALVGLGLVALGFVPRKRA